jgi:hypothetical protein
MFTKEFLKMIKEVDLEYVCLQVELYIKEIGKMMYLPDKVFCIVVRMKSWKQLLIMDIFP